MLREKKKKPCSFVGNETLTGRIIQKDSLWRGMCLSVDECCQEIDGTGDMFVWSVIVIFNPHCIFESPKELLENTDSKATS